MAHLHHRKLLCRQVRNIAPILQLGQPQPALLQQGELGALLPALVVSSSCRWRMARLAVAVPQAKKESYLCNAAIIKYTRDRRPTRR